MMIELVKCIKCCAVNVRQKLKTLILIKSLKDQAANLLLSNVEIL